MTERVGSYRVDFEIVPQKDGPPPFVANELRLTTISYRRLVNLGRYENEHLEASATLFPEDDPALVAAKLRAWVNAQLAAPPLTAKEGVDLGDF